MLARRIPEIIIVAFILSAPVFSLVIVIITVVIRAAIIT